MFTNNLLYFCKYCYLSINVNYKFVIFHFIILPQLTLCEHFKSITFVAFICMHKWHFISKILCILISFSAKVFSLVALIESISTLAATSLFNTVYNATLNLYHGFCFLMGAALVLICIFIAM